MRYRVLGVMTIQSTRVNAYAENERLVFRTLCAYTAIGLDNAMAYTHLRDAKDQLVVHEKLAASGSLVAGVAHELNTPLGNSLLTATTLQENTAALEAAAASGSMRRSTLTDYIASCREGLGLVSRGLRSAGELVQSFKQGGHAIAGKTGTQYLGGGPLQRRWGGDCHGEFEADF